MSNSRNCCTCTDSIDVYRGKSFHYAGDWTVGQIYSNDEYQVDFVTYDGKLWACYRSHQAEETYRPSPHADCWRLAVDAVKGNPGDVYIPELGIDRESIVFKKVPFENLPNSLVFDIRGAKGDKGDKGDRGERGDDGVKGDKGDRGDKGEKGDRGDQGPQGIQGIKGDKGDDGRDGRDGRDGERGEVGPQGLQGERGDKGEKGDKGDKGEKGDKGDKGDTGVVEDPINFLLKAYKSSPGKRVEDSRNPGSFINVHLSDDEFLEAFGNLSPVNGFEIREAESFEALGKATADKVGYLYLVPSSEGNTNDLFDEWVVISSGETAVGEESYRWEKWGSASVNLDNYYTKEEVSDLIQSEIGNVDGGIADTSGWV